MHQNSDTGLAGVYEIVRDEAGGSPQLQINAQNCVLQNM